MKRAYKYKEPVNKSTQIRLLFSLHDETGI